MMPDMGGRHAVWLLLLPLAGAGHGYLVVAAPAVIAFAATLLLAGIALAIGDGLRGRSRSHLPGWRVGWSRHWGSPSKSMLSC
jgi:hypothetical protein